MQARIINYMYLKHAFDSIRDTQNPPKDADQHRKHKLIGHIFP